MVIGRLILIALVKTPTSREKNKVLYQNIFDKINFDTTARCLMLRIYSNNLVYEEYGLYDYKTQFFFYSSIGNNEPYRFKTSSTLKSRKIFDIMKEFVKNPNDAINYVQNEKRLMDGNNFELSLITVNTRKEVIVESYYW